MKRAEHWVLLISIAIAVIAFSLRSETPAPAPKPRASPALAALPPGAAFAASVDLVSLRKSPLAPILDANGQLFGVGKLGEICGFDPTASVREVAIAIPESNAGARGQNPDFGLAASGDFDADAIAVCVAKIVQRRGGEPAKSRLDSFVSVRDRRRPSGEVAVRDGGPLLLGGGSYLREMVDAAQGNAPTLLGDEAHGALRRTLGGSRPVVATWISRPGWLERWLELDAPTDSPLADVRAGALGIDFSPELTAVLLLACPSDAACDRLAKWLEGIEHEARAGIARAFGADPIRDAKLGREPSAVRITLHFDALRAATVIGALLPPPTPARDD